MKVIPDPTSPGQESVWSYPRPAVAEPSQRRLKVVHRDLIIAETRKGIRTLETSHPPSYYFPPADIAPLVLQPSRRRSLCEWKGEAIYFDVVVRDETLRDVAWSYPDPNPAFRSLRDHVAFYAWLFDGCFVGARDAATRKFLWRVDLFRCRRPFQGSAGHELLVTVGQSARWRWRDIVDARLCLRRRHRIETPYGEIQRGGERNPRKVGHEQQRGDDVDRIEKHDGRYDGHPDQNNVDEAEIGAVQAEEERRPCCVENQLQGIHSQGQAGVREAGVPPDQPPGNRNHQIEDGHTPARKAGSAAAKTASSIAHTSRRDETMRPSAPRG